MAEALDSAGELVYRVELDRDDCRRGPFTESQFGREAVAPGLFRYLSAKPRLDASPMPVPWARERACRSLGP
jgi:hypothetical protein